MEYVWYLNSRGQAYNAVTKWVTVQLKHEITVNLQFNPGNQTDTALFPSTEIIK